MSRPLEVRVPAAVLVGGAALFVVLGLVRGDTGAAQFPLWQLAFAALAAGALWLRLPLARGGALTVTALIALAHALIALAELPWWFRAASGLIAAAHAYAAVLLLTAPARRDQGGPTRE